MGSKPKAPKTVAAPDPQVEAQKAADLAAQKANEETATRKTVSYTHLTLPTNREV